MSAWSYEEDSGQNTGESSLSLLQGLFLTQGSNPSLPHSRQILYQLSHKESVVWIILNLKINTIKLLSRTESLTEKELLGGLILVNLNRNNMDKDVLGA